jgi:hypothetical protein
MPAVEFSNITDLKRQAVEKKAREFYENNDPGMKAFGKAVDKPPLTEKGYRLPNYSTRPSGETWFVPSNSDFNAAGPMQTVSMWVYPTMYAFPMLWTGSAIESMENDTEDNIESYEDIMTKYSETAQKRLEQYFYGDGTASLAYSASTISSLGSNTLTCTTAASTTPGQTKGSSQLWPNWTFQAINTSTAQVRGTFTVTTAGSASCTINLTSGTISSGDPIVSVGAYQMAMRGLGWLISNQTRVLQGLSTSQFPDLNSPGVDLAGALLTPAAIENTKALLQTRNNAADAKNNLTAFLTWGQYSTIRKQGYNLSYYIRNQENSENMKGVQGDYTDGDTRFICAGDMDDDRVYFAQTSQMKMYEQKKFGKYNRDGLQQRMLLGANGTGSDNYSSALGWKGNLANLSPRSTAFIQRAQEFS